MITFEHVSKVYGEGHRPALAEVTLQIDKGDFVFLVGPSGSGKSTFLRLVLKEERASSGSVQVAGRDVGRLRSWKVPALRRQIGVVFQDFRLLADKSVYENVAFALQVLGKPRHVIAQTVPETLGLVGLAGKEKRRPHELSGVSSSASPSRARSSTGPRCCWPTSPPGTSTPRPASGS